MKHYLTLFVLIAVTGIISGNSHNYNLPGNCYNDLLGKWNLQTISIKITDSQNKVIQEVGDQSVVGQMIMEFEFKENNKVIHHGNVKYLETGQTHYEEGTYQVLGDKLTISINNEPLTFKIILNDEKNLHLDLAGVKDFQGQSVNHSLIYKFTKSNDK